MLRRLRTLLLLSAALVAVGTFTTPAMACPMCQAANESKEEDRIPQAYMYSILFMLAMPATLLTGFGIGFYRLSHRSDGSDAESPSTHHVTPDHDGHRG